MATASSQPGPPLADRPRAEADGEGPESDRLPSVGATPDGIASDQAAPDGTTVSGADVREATRAAAIWLEAQAAGVNALNIFPVPDGDTGTNMSLTMRAAADAAEAEPSPRAGDVARAVAHGALMGARGNSGVILSQLLRGFAEAAADKPHLTIRDVADGLAAASEAGYRAVGRPVEGTILTVARRAAEAAGEAAPRSRTVSKLLEQVLRAADRAVAETTEQLETLRQAGVVDAGGQGYRLIVEAFWRVACGRPVDPSAVGEAAPVASGALVAAQHARGLGFCTEFLLREPSAGVDEVRAFMESIGDSVLVVGDASLVRVHVHALRPGAALDYAVERGTLASIKVENMQLQHETADEPASAEGTSNVGVVAVAPGAGFRQLLRSMGAAALVEGGQTMNPSVQDVLAAVNGVGYRELIVLPNNANVLLAVTQAAEQTPRALRVVPTRSLPQGVAALLAFNYEADLDTNARLMEEAAGRVRTIELTRAVRSAQLQGWQVERGQCLGLLDDELVAVADDLVTAGLDALARCEPALREIVTVYVGADVEPERASGLADAIRTAYPQLEVEVAEGGQPHYPYILSVE